VRVGAALVLAGAALAAAGEAAAQFSCPASAAPAAASGADPAELAVGYLRRERAALGLGADALDEVVVQSRHRGRRGTTHLALRQQVDGIDVFGGGAVVAVDAAGRIVALGRRLVPELRSRIGARHPALSPEQAVERAAVHLGLGVQPLRVAHRPGGPARGVVFEGGDLSRDAIPVKLEYVESGGAVRLAWNVVLRTPEGAHWWNLHVDATGGEVLRRDDWIDRDSYLVFEQPLMSPDEGAQSQVTSPADPVASPFGWHDTDGAPGAEFSDTRGNNVSAQEDADGDDAAGYRPDAPGLAFHFPVAGGLQPSGYRDAAIANAFYWSNLLHDVHYRYGFDEPAGNFQLDNRGNGGLAGDPVQVDAQDGADVDNAQFGTPPDGFEPRMDLFLWEQAPAPRLDVAAPPAVAGSYAVGKAFFGAGTLGLSGEVVRALDAANGAGPSTTDACSPLTNAGAVAGRLALIDRGTCLFVEKVANAQAAGAIGVIIVNNVASPPLINMLGVAPDLVVPVVSVSLADGSAIAAQLGAGVVASIVSPADRDASLDSGLIVHEYGHGVSNRLTGGPGDVSCLDAPESQGMGEGWSDWWALVFTARAEDAPEDPRSLAPYLLGEPPSGPGIRNFPYSSDLGVSPLDYGDVSSLNQPHGVGEVWAAALWEVYWNLVFARGFDPDLAEGQGGNNLLLSLVTDALKLQPCDPTFVEGRDAILCADQIASAGEHRCLIWSGFAKRGVGQSASDGGGPFNLNVAAAFDVPAECQPDCGDGTLQVGEQCDDGNQDPGDGCEADCSLPLPEPSGETLLLAGLLLLRLLARSRIAR
jgi:cysteine-rich repeat protein